MKWIGAGRPNRWGLKRDIPKCWQHWAVRVDFPFERVWLVWDNEGRVYMEDGQWARTVEFYLRTPGHVIGLRDMAGADNRDWAIEVSPDHRIISNRVINPYAVGVGCAFHPKFAIHLARI